VRISAIQRLRSQDPRPDWAAATLAEAPWVVVRRAPTRSPWIPVGVRGAARWQRWAAWIAEGDLVERLTPESLTARLTGVCATRRSKAPALAAGAAFHATVRSDDAPLIWGPTGSVGFELASGQPTATAASDLDALVRCPAPVSRAQVQAWADAFAKAASPFGVRCDILLETPQGAVALADYAKGLGTVMLRTPAGPRLAGDPWVEGVDAP
jgi:phosphoribosyl-dephospho-CoA transferase